MNILDINVFFDEYIRLNNLFSSEKQNVLENLKKKENRMKFYEEALSNLEKENNEINFNIFQKETKEFMNVLLNFNTEDIDSNTQLVYNSIAYLETIKYDLSEISKKYFHIKNFWENYAKKKYKIKSSALFAKDIEKELKEISEEIKFVELSELQRLEDHIESVKLKIERSVSLINELSQLEKDHIFIGQEEILFKNKLEDFIKTKYYNSSLSEISDFAQKTKDTFEELKSKNKVIRNKIPVYKIINKTGRVHSYAIEPKKGIFINVTDTEIENPIYKSSGKFIYIENYPVHGIFEKEFLKEELQVPDEQFEAIKDFEAITTNYFIFFSSLSILTIIMNLIGELPIIQTILLISLYPLLFIFFFGRTKKKIDKRYNLKDFFHFFETNYYIVKEGDSLLKPQYIISNIFINFSKLFEVNLKNLNENKQKENILLEESDTEEQRILKKGKKEGKIFEKKDKIKKKKNLLNKIKNFVKNKRKK